MKRIRMLGISASLLLVAVSAGAQTTFFTNGVLRNQMWTSPDQSRVNIENGVAGTPNSDTIDLTAFEYPTSSPNIDNWGQRISGLFIPAVTTNYVFFCASDDDGDLFLSTDATATNKRLIAQEATWDNYRGWIGSPQKRSDQWTNATGAAPYKNGIPLVAGQKYWIEYVKHDGGGGDDAGATFKIVGEPDPANNDASLLTGSLIGYGLTFTAPITVKTDVNNATTLVGLPATFTFVPNNPSPDPLLGNVLSYQWYRNGAPITNATGPSYTIVPTATDSGAQFQAIAMLDPQYNISLSVTSKVGTLTVNTGSLTYTNGLKLERFPNATRQTLEAGSVGAADLVTVSINGAEAPVNDGVNNYAHRMSGWYIPPADGNYVFFLSSDDDSDLFLSTDATAANKQLIAQANNWSASREWLTANGGGITNPADPAVFLKRSDQWTNDLGVAPFTNGIHLLKGNAYYIEADQSQGGGGDNLAILAQIVGTVDPTNGTPPIPANQLALITKPTTTLTFTNLPRNTTVFEGAAPIFTSGATSDSEFGVLYQWQRNGTNIPGATAKTYSFTTVSADSGSTFDVVASTAEGGFTTNSPTVTLTVQTAVFEPGLALMEYWLNKGGDLTIPEGGAFGPPDFVMAVPAFEAGLNGENGNTYVSHLSGDFIPATDGAYDFIVSGDDHVDVFLSTDANPNNKRLICQQPGWSGALVWDDGATPLPGGTGNPGNNSASDRNQMNSGTWTNAAGARPNGNGIQLTHGVHYYLEAWHQEGGGGDSVAVTAIKHNDPIPANGTDSSIKGSQLGFNAPSTATYVMFTNQPASESVLSGGTATFSAGGTSDGTLEIGTTGIFNTSGDVPNVGAFKQFPNILFQWYKNGVLIPGATTSTYTTPALKPTDSAQYYLAIRALGMANWSNSVTATLTVIADTNKPTAYAAEFDNNLIPTVSVSFDKTMDLASISDMSHYTVAGATITSILVNSNDSRHVTLQLASTPTTLPASLTFTGITDFSGNALTSTTVSVPASELTNLDIGDALSNDPAFPGFMWVDGANAYTVKCEGSDIWGGADGFNFSYETKTNDFDVAVRQLTFTKTSQWSKGGLMVREDLSAPSRNWNIINGPSNADGTQALDGNGTGQNQVECNARFATGGNSGGWDTGTRPPPTYPNAWVRLKRVGQTLTAYASSNGVQWVERAYTDWSTNAPAMPSVVYVGICASAHLNDNPVADPPLDYYTASFANYNSSFVASTNSAQATVSASVSGGNIVISWTPAGGTLQSSPTVGAGATWTPVTGASNPATIPLSGANAKFFRVGP
jgi:hypothetical protein